MRAGSVRVVSGHVFISYSHAAADSAYVHRLAEYLTAARVVVWFDREIVSGSRWHAVIEERINSCDAFIVVMSPGARESQWVNREIDQADRQRKPIFPLLLEGDRFFRLADVQYEDVTGGRMPSPEYITQLPRQVPEPSPPPARAARGRAAVSGDGVQNLLEAQVVIASAETQQSGWQSGDEVDLSAVGKHDAFLSYAWEDRATAAELERALREEGFDIWFAGFHLRPGDSIRQSLDRGLSRSRYGIVLLSPSLLKLRPWTQYELDAIVNAEVGGRKVLLPVWLDVTAERIREVMPALAGRMAVHWADGVTTVAHQLASVIRPVSKSRRRDTLERRMFDRMYHYRDAIAPALRLVGASTESFAAGDVSTLARNEPYVLPQKYRDHHAELVDKLRAEAESTNKVLFNGPAVRMLNYRVLVPDVDTEAKSLQLEVAPLPYFDYSIIRRISDAAMEDNGVDRLDQFIDVGSIAFGANLSTSSLSNIIDTAITVITQDGHLFYTERGVQVGDRGGWHTSAVAEGVHAVKDGIEFSGKEPQDLGLGVPYRTATRGIAEEMSPRLAEIIDSHGWAQHLRLLGLSFDLEGFHPSLLFLLVVPLAVTDVHRICRESPGKDFQEGSLRSTHIGDGPFDIVRSLATTPWTGGGAASVIRSLEYIDATAQEQGLESFDAAIHWILRTGQGQD
jgi:hypothetical protein